MEIVIIGAGPAGLTAAYLFSKKNIPVTVLEADPIYVGGLSKTVEYKGYHFDIGGHRFFSKSKQVEDLWNEILGKDMLIRSRKSSIFYKRKFYSYPLKAIEALSNLGIIESSACVMSYIYSRIFPVKNPKNFEDWVSNRFGKRLFRIFFKTYTEKVWGMNCKDISADWAAQRIKKLSLFEAIKNAIFHNKIKNKSEIITTLIDSFRYPRKGPGMMWKKAAQFILENGGTIKMNAEVKSLEYDNSSRKWKVWFSSSEQPIVCDHVISSAPLGETLISLKPNPGIDILNSANSLKYRDFIIVALIVDVANCFDDNWIYIHEPNVKVGRVENFKSWSPEMVPDPSKTCLGLEYFCFEGDGLWESTDTELIELAKSEICSLGLVKKETIIDGSVIRQKKAYPVYDDYYSDHILKIREKLEKSYPNLHLVGRNGMHKYNNQDHAMMTAMLTVENILAEKKIYDVWEVNQDAEYLEEGESGKKENIEKIEERIVPGRVNTGNR